MIHTQLGTLQMMIEILFKNNNDELIDAKFVINAFWNVNQQYEMHS